MMQPIQQSPSPVNNLILPSKAFLLFPSEEKIVILPTSTNKLQFPKRLIYGQSGHFPPLLSFEENQLEQFSQYCKKEAPPSLVIQLQNESKIALLKILHANKFNFEKALKHYSEYKDWARQFIPISRINPFYRQQMDDLLKQGVCYTLPTRDQYLKPIIVVHLGRLLEIKPDIKLFINTFGYFLQTLIDEYMIDGQLQTWNVIVDVDKNGVFSFAGALFDVIKFLSKMFVGRMYRCYVLNFNFMLKLVWGTVSLMMDEEQNDKCRILQFGKILEFIPREALEKRHGGDIELTSFWPLDSDERLKISQEFQKKVQHIWDRQNALINQKQYYYEQYLYGKTGSRLQSNIIQKYNKKQQAKKLQEQSDPTIPSNFKALSVLQRQHYMDFINLQHMPKILRFQESDHGQQQEKSLQKLKNLMTKKPSSNIINDNEMIQSPRKRNDLLGYSRTVGKGQQIKIKLCFLQQKGYKDVFQV